MLEPCAIFPSYVRQLFPLSLQVFLSPLIVFLCFLSLACLSSSSVDVIPPGSSYFLSALFALAASDCFACSCNFCQICFCFVNVGNEELRCCLFGRKAMFVLPFRLQACPICTTWSLNRHCSTCLTLTNFRLKESSWSQGLRFVPHVLFHSYLPLSGIISFWVQLAG